MLTASSRRKAFAGWSAVWLLAAAAMASAREPFTVVDSAGALVGPAMDLTSDSSGAVVQINVPVRVGAQRVVLAVDRKGYWRDERRPLQLYFTEPGCAGTAYVAQAAQGRATAPRAILGERDTLWVADADVATIRPASTFVARNATGNPCYAAGATEPFAAHALRRVLDLADRFKPPFRLSATAEAIDLAQGAP